MKKKLPPTSSFNLTEFAQRYFVFGLVIIAAFAFITRVWRLHQPETYMFDEVYHAVTAKLIAHNDYRAFDWYAPPPEPNTAVDWLHPPLAKYTQALSMLVFGENSFGWRFSSVLAGTAVVVMTGLLAKTMFQRPILGWLAATLASLDGLLLVQSRIAMNDIHVTLAILVALWFYLKAHPLSRKLAQETKPQDILTGTWSQTGLNWLVVGVAAGVATGSKWSGVFVLAIIGAREAWWLASHYPLVTTWSLTMRRSFVGLTLIKLFTLLVIPILIYLASYTMFFTQGRTWADFKELHWQIWHYQTTLEAEHPFQSRPYQWWLNLRPVWVYVKYSEPTLPELSTEKAPSINKNWVLKLLSIPPDNQTVANIYSFGNPLLFWLGDIAIIMSVVIVIKLASDFYSLSPQRRRDLPALQLALLSYALVWMPWVTSPRIMFFYHYSPAVPWLCVLLAYWLDRGIQTSKWPVTEKIILVGLPLVLIAVCFAVWYPHWTAIPVPVWWAERVYFALDSWQ